jgi:hypothetical protein
MKVNDIRELITTTLHDLGLGDAKPTGERLLIQDQFYLGCRFDFEGASAIWLEDFGQVRFFGDTGRLLKVVRVKMSGEDEVAKQAA